MSFQEFHFEQANKLTSIQPIVLFVKYYSTENTTRCTLLSLFACYKWNSGKLNTPDYQYLLSGGSRISHRGAWTSDMGAFQQICMRKRKNLVP